MVQNAIALSELMGFDFLLLSLDRLYRAWDHLMKHKVAIKEHLCEIETRLFGLREKIFLYDLTNTFLEGSDKYNLRAQYGKSKERRNDCPLVTLGLVLDTHGFPRRRRIFEGNVNGPGTSETMILGLSQNNTRQYSLFKPTIVMDAGIASDDNLHPLPTPLREVGNVELIGGPLSSALKGNPV